MNPSPPPEPSGSDESAGGATESESAARERLQEIFHEAIERPVEERAAILAEACGDDAALRERVECLLTAYERSEDVFEAPISPEIERELARLKPEQVGDTIGPYKLREMLGEGGFGTVWVAEQERPVRRRVALKILKTGMDTKEVIGRFEQERQALAMMDHPNIARVFDAGATQFGRPFFVMELVRGVRVTDYCDHQELSTRERLELFIEVCQAVQHAHQKGIIHRDLKPSNILVTVNDGKPVPKVIDFGVAKATLGRLTDRTVYTQFQQMVGTPLYMSPEQAELTSLDIDTRSDIYSLGVLLYELLTGCTPIDGETLARAGLDEIRRLVREVDPAPPSARLKLLPGPALNTTAKLRHSEPVKLTGILRGDLDWIVMKCVEKDRTRRYETANGLAQDLRRHLENEVVTARPPSRVYRFGRFARRNKMAFAAGAGMAAALMIGAGVSAWQAFRANRMVDELRATAPAFVEQAKVLVEKERFDDAIEKLDYAIKLRPDTPQYLVSKADLLQCQLKLAEAAAIYRKALRVKPDFARAEASAKLCEELLAAPRSEQGKLTRETLAKLHLGMRQDQRPAAELIPVARLLGEEKNLLVKYWLARLKDLPVSRDYPLEARLTLREDGLLALDLSNTKIANLDPLVGMPLGDLDLSICVRINDFSLLGGFHSLRRLALKGTTIGDISTLRGSPLEDLDLGSTPIVDISVLRGMDLKRISLRGTNITDLSPLASMPLIDFDGSQIPATDFSSLSGAPLKRCILNRSAVHSLAFLRMSPVRELSLQGCDRLRDFASLASLKELETLVLPGSFQDKMQPESIAAIDVLRKHPTLRNIGIGWWSEEDILKAQPKEVFWHEWDMVQNLRGALRDQGFAFSLLRFPDATYRLEIRQQPFRDLSVVKGIPISELWLDGCEVNDLSPLQGFGLRILGLYGNPVADLEPLRGMPLEDLSLERSKVRDLSPLLGLPLRKLYLQECEDVMDVSVLAGIPTLQKLTIPPHARNIEALRKLPNLKWLAYRFSDKHPDFPGSTADDFWKNWDAEKAPARPEK